MPPFNEWPGECQLCDKRGIGEIDTTGGKAAAYLVPRCLEHATFGGASLLTQLQAFVPGSLSMLIATRVFGFQYVASPWWEW